MAPPFIESTWNKNRQNIDLWILVVFPIDYIFLEKSLKHSKIQFYHLKNCNAIFQDSCKD